MAARRRILLAVPVLVLAFVLAGCAPAAPTPSAKPPSISAAPSSPATPAPATGFLADGTAQANKAWFDAVNTKLFASNGSANGRTIIDSLVAAGFDKTAMQVTPDKTSINGGVDSILFSVKIGDSCLLGQHGGGGYSSAVEAALKSGLCLIGKTRAIDW
jgi:ABC-type transport system substrate-binding protein